jgi:hypothetical protein
MEQDPPPIDEAPGFRRRFVVTPGDGWVRADLEDDYHCMTVILHHENGIVTKVEPRMHRAPWTTCPGAEAQLQDAFTNLPLADFVPRGGKTLCCTHLHDLAVIGAAHSGDDQPTLYDVLVSDPVNGDIRAELRLNGKTLLNWALHGFRITAPADLAGMTIDKIHPWLESLDPAMREAAKVFRWAIMIARGRSVPMENQSDATQMRPKCFTFQPDVAAMAKRVGVIRDFSVAGAFPLDGFSND